MPSRVGTRSEPDLAISRAISALRPSSGSRSGKQLAKSTLAMSAATMQRAARVPSAREAAVGVPRGGWELIAGQYFSPHRLAKCCLERLVAFLGSHLCNISYRILWRVNVLDWLLDSDPAIRWQVLRDLVHAPAEIVAEERARGATEGWGARLLALQGEDGQWAGGACFPAQGWRRAENQGSPGPPRSRHSNCCVISESIRALTGCGGRWRWSETTAVGSTPDSRSSAARSSRASMAGPSPWAPTSIKVWMASSPACWVSSSRTAGGTARRRTVPSARRSRPRST